ncbi:glycosyltransferase family 4 protein [Candidatus Acidulodesulfobacterium sp. H_13]|uniref:glycosyltransferase family 4 protein n=1 Tax=Candidatus Acidulodesulfobacterium sp. H_13 TaxID=3395470 RepID=UPI003AF715A6
MSKNSLLIDVIPLLSQLTGIGRYIYEIAKVLETDDAFDISYFYGYYSKNLVKPDNMSELKSLKSFLVRNSVVKKLARKYLILFSKIFVHRFSLYWVPNFIPLDGIKADKIVSTVHDFSFYVHPEWHPQERLDYFNTNFYKNIKKSDWIITGSEFFKNEIIEYLKFDAEKITVIYHGVDNGLFKRYDKNVLSVTKEKFNLADNFLLFVGSIEPRKNLLNTLKAYRLLNDDVKENYPFVLVGFKGWKKNTEIMQEIEKEKKYVRYLGYLSDEELAHVYNLATLFVCPSLYEGFGIPPLEAMACGTTTIVSNVASLSEACGDATLYINPNDIEDIAAKIKMLLNDENLQKDLTEKGLERVKQFTWEKSAQAHKKVFEKVLKI